jgi:hypothetical protein
MATDPHRPVVLSNFLTEVEAGLLIAYLQGQGIKAFNSGAGGATGWPDAAAYSQVVVREVDLPQAKELLEEWLSAESFEESSESVEERDDEPNA